MRTAGQEQPATLSTDRTPKGLLHSDTCRMIYFGNSAEAAVGDLSEPRLLRITYRPLPAKFTEWLLFDCPSDRTRP